MNEISLMDSRLLLVIVITVSSHVFLSCSQQTFEETELSMQTCAAVGGVEWIKAGYRNKNIGRTDEKGRTPLHYAAWAGNRSTASALIDFGADVNARDEYGRTPLQYAAMAGHLRLVMLLHKNGGHLVGGSGAGLPIRAASKNGHADVVEYLKNNGGLPNGTDTVHIAAHEGHLAVLEVLLGTEPACSMDKTIDFGTPLHYAVKGSHPAAVRYLLEKGAQVSAESPKGETPLEIAARFRDEASARMLIGAGANVDNVFVATLINDSNKLRQLLEPPHKGMKATIGPSQVPLWYYAAEVGSLPCMRLLLEKGFDPNTVWRDRTALYAAVGSGDIEMIRLLLDHGAEINAKANIAGHTGHKRSPLKLATRYGGINTVVFLLERGAKLPSDEEDRLQFLKNVFSLGVQEENILLFLDKKMEDLAWTENNNTNEILLRAAGCGCIRTLKWLVSKGCEPTLKGKFGDTPLHMACGNGEYQIAKYLLLQGASVNVRNDAGQTPLIAAVDYGSPAIALLLLEEGASIDVVDEKSQTAIDLARLNGKWAFLTVLVNHLKRPPRYKGQGQ